MTGGHASGKPRGIERMPAAPRRCYSAPVLARRTRRTRPFRVLGLVGIVATTGCPDDGDEDDGDDDGSLACVDVDPVGCAELYPPSWDRVYTDTLVAKFALPVDGWRGNRR